MENEKLKEAISSNLITITSNGCVRDERDYINAKSMSLDIIYLVRQAINVSKSKEDIINILLETFEDMKNTNHKQFIAKASK
jgi:hypothetical protein